MLPQEIIRKTRNKEVITKEEIDFLIKGISSGEIADVQAASFTMAVFLNGLSKDEILNLLGLQALVLCNLGYESNHKQYISKRMRLCSSKTICKSMRSYMIGFFIFTKTKLYTIV